MMLYGALAGGAVGALYSGVSDTSLGTGVLAGAALGALGAKSYQYFGSAKGKELVGAIKNDFSALKGSVSGRLASAANTGTAKTVASAPVDIELLATKRQILENSINAKEKARGSLLNIKEKLDPIEQHRIQTSNDMKKLGFDIDNLSFPLDGSDIKAAFNQTRIFNAQGRLAQAAKMRERDIKAGTAF